MNRYLVVALAPVSWLSAQEVLPRFVPQTLPTAHVRCEGIDQLRAVWPQTKIGRLFADPDIEAMVEKFVDWSDAKYERRQAMLKVASYLDLEMDSYAITSMYMQADPFGQLNVPLAEIKRLEFYSSMAMVEGRPRQTTINVLSCMPKFEGRWRQKFEREASLLRVAPWSEERPAGKVDGFDAYRFAPPAATLEALGERGSHLGKWMMHLPGTFISGSGLPEEVGSLDMEAEAVDPGLSFALSIQDYLQAFRMGGDFPTGFGLESLLSLRWSSGFDGEDLVERFELAFVDGVTPTGLVAALLSGEGDLVSQALPKKALAQLRFNVGYEKLMTVIEELSGGALDLPQEIEADAFKMLDGSVALGVCAPTGGLIPQLFLTLGVADEEAFDRVVARAVADGLPVTNVTYGGVVCTVLKIPGMPGGVQPAFCRIGKTLHIAESGLSLRAFLKVQKDGVDAMDVGDARVVKGVGELVKNFDARFNLALLYRTYYKTWLPLLEMNLPKERPVSRIDMPDPDVIDEHVGFIRGVSYRDGKRYVASHIGCAGPVLAAYLMAWPMVVVAQGDDHSTQSMSAAVASHKLRKVWESLDAFEKREGRLPHDLGELFVAEKLPGDALLMPGDDLAEEITLPNGSREKTSFRYFPDGVSINSLGKPDVLFVEIRPSSTYRTYLRRDGDTRRMYSTQSLDPIDSFGK